MVVVGARTDTPPTNDDNSPLGINTGDALFLPTLEPVDKSNSSSVHGSIDISGDRIVLIVYSMSWYSKQHG